MKTISVKSFLIVAGLFAGSIMVNAQSLPVSFSGQFGYTVPQGGWFENAEGESMTRFGLNVDFDALWHLERFNRRLGVGITYNSSFLFGADLGAGLDVGIYGLSLYGVKGQWRFFNSRVSPYASLSLGLARFSTPEVTMHVGGSSTVVAEAEHAFGFGVRPEIGIEFGVFVISVGYIVPMNYTIGNDTYSAGGLQFSIGTRISLFDRR